MVVKGRGLASGGQESRSVFSAVVCKIQASKCYIECLLLVTKDNVKGLLYSCLLIARLPSRSKIWKPSIRG